MKLMIIKKIFIYNYYFSSRFYVECQKFGGDDNNRDDLCVCPVRFKMKWNNGVRQARLCFLQSLIDSFAFSSFVQDFFLFPATFRIYFSVRRQYRRVAVKKGWCVDFVRPGNF